MIWCGYWFCLLILMFLFVSSPGGNPTACKTQNQSAPYHVLYSFQTLILYVPLFGEKVQDYILVMKLSYACPRFAPHVFFCADLYLLITVLCVRCCVLVTQNVMRAVTVSVTVFRYYSGCLIQTSPFFSTLASIRCACRSARTRGWQTSSTCNISTLSEGQFISIFSPNTYFSVCFSVWHDNDAIMKHSAVLE